MRPAHDENGELVIPSLVISFATDCDKLTIPRKNMRHLQAILTYNELAFALGSSYYGRPLSSRKQIPR